MSKPVTMIAPHFQEYTLLLANAMARHAPVTLMIDRRRLDSEFAGRPMPLHPAVTLCDVDLRSPLDLVKILGTMFRTRSGVLHIQEPSGLLKAMICAVAATVGKALGVVALTVHDPVPHDGRDADIVRRMARVRSYLRKRADIVFVHGEYCRSAYAGLNLSSTQRIVMTDHGTILVDQPGAAAENATLQLLCFGRMEAYKGIEILCEATEQALAEGAQFHLAMAGGGPEMDRLEPRFARLANVTINNRFIPSVELIAAMRKADCVVMPYLSATQSGVLASALANGCFVIASRVGGIPDVVDHMESAILIPPGDPVALKDAIMMVAADPTLRARLKQGALDVADTKLDWNRIADDMAVAYVR